MLIVGEKTAANGGGRLGSRGVEQRGKRTRGHGQQCGDCWGRRCKGTKW